jgi:adenine-specific DNA methylase
MKYMGSKRAMLQNGLGELLDRESHGIARFADMFAGSAVVAGHVARKYPVSVVASDLQEFSAVLANAVISRDCAIDWRPIWHRWRQRAESKFHAHALPPFAKITKSSVQDIRTWCDTSSTVPITRAYGGHYFSLTQAVWLDSLRATLPSRQPENTVALAALIRAASQCAAAPGHTAQPFQPTRTAKPFLAEAWSRDVVQRTKAQFSLLAPVHAIVKGYATVCDAVDLAANLGERDLTFIDPPYSGVHYSRFYHVLETIAVGQCGEVSGTGRYPAPTLRPRSSYSLRSQSNSALNALFKQIAAKGASAVLTFPSHACSNGLSGDVVRDLAAQHFRITKQLVKSRFSSLGGTGVKREGISSRNAQRSADELLLVLRPK